MASSLSIFTLKEPPVFGLMEPLQSADFRLWTGYYFLTFKEFARVSPRVGVFESFFHPAPPDRHHVGADPVWLHTVIDSGKASPHSLKSRLLVMTVAPRSLHSATRSWKSSSCGARKGFNPKSSINVELNINGRSWVPAH